MRGLVANTKLYNHQKLGKDFILKRKYVLIGDQPGLGKTLQALAALVETDKVALIVCPAFLRENWKNEVDKFTNLSSRIVTSKEKYETVPDVLIVSYEGAKNVPREIPFGFIILDESHYIKNYQAKRTKSVVELVGASSPEYLVALSGTPILNSVIEFYTILKLLSYCPSGTNGIPIAERSQYAFSAKFSNKQTREINVPSRRGSSTVKLTEYRGVRNVDTLKSYLRGKYLRRLASKVLDLPRVTDIPLKVTGNNKTLDAKLMAEFQDWLDSGGGKLTEHITHLKIASAMNKVPSTAKLVIDLVEQGEQVVVFSDHRDPVQTILNSLPQNVTHDKLVGGMSSQSRQEIVQRFQAKKLQVVVCTIGAASTGITLTSACKMVFNDLPWRPADLEQARRRIDRISQKRPVTIYNMIGGDFDSKLQDKLQEKMKNIGSIISGKGV